MFYPNTPYTHSSLNSLENSRIIEYVIGKWLFKTILVQSTEAINSTMKMLIWNGLKSLKYHIYKTNEAINKWTLVER
jgi:hypothetical protein